MPPFRGMEDVFLALGSVVGGAVFGSICFLLVRTTRWMLLRADQSTLVTDPNGSHWLVGIPLAPSSLKLRASRRVFGMRLEDRARRLRAGVVEDGVERTEVVHPRALLKAADEALGIFAMILLGGLLIALLVFVLEIAVAVLAAVLVAVMRFALGRWQCEVTTPDGRREQHPAGSLRAARELRDELIASIQSGMRASTA